MNEAETKAEYIDPALEAAGRGVVDAEGAAGAPVHARAALASPV